MDLKPEATPPKTSQNADYAEPLPRKSLVLLRDTEALLRCKTVETLLPVLPLRMANKLQKGSDVAENLLNQLAEVDLDQISDQELRPARILVGLTFVGFSSLAIVLLILYLCTLHPELSQVEQIWAYWHQYIWFVCLGVAGMFVLGREAMRLEAGDRVNASIAKSNSGKVRR